MTSTFRRNCVNALVKGGTGGDGGESVNAVGGTGGDSGNSDLIGDSTLDVGELSIGGDGGDGGLRGTVGGRGGRGGNASVRGSYIADDGYWISAEPVAEVMAVRAVPIPVKTPSGGTVSRSVRRNRHLLLRSSAFPHPP